MENQLIERDPEAPQENLMISVFHNGTYLPAVFMKINGDQVDPRIRNEFQDPTVSTLFIETGEDHD